jgi:hypothetical protein
MIYTVKKQELGFSASIDDTILMPDQPKAFRDIFNDLRQGDTAEFDDCTAFLMPSGRILFTEKNNENGTFFF